MKKVILILFLLVTFVSNTFSKDPIWLKTNGLKVTTVQEWPDEWFTCNIYIKFDFDNDKIVIYSKELQVFTIDTIYSIYYKDYYQIFSYKCLDINDKICYIYLYYDYEDELFRSLVIKYDEGMYAYKLY